MEIAGIDPRDQTEAQSRGQTFVLHVCVPHNGLGLLRLAGRDPNEG